MDVSNFLNLHSQKKHDDFCLAYVFTFRDFTGGTLGLAWVASPSGRSSEDAGGRGGGYWDKVEEGCFFVIDSEVDDVNVLSVNER